MKPPIFAYNKGDLIVFNSAIFAESYIEAIDVRNKEYIIYDSEGRLLRANIEKVAGYFGRERAKLEDAESEATHQRELKKIIMEYLNNTNTFLPEKLELAKLVAIVRKHAIDT